MQALERMLPVLTLLLLITGIVTAISLWQIASETGERACIEAAQARYPAVPVSAFVTRDRSATGPLKLSYIRERTKAVDACD